MSRDQQMRTGAGGRLVARAVAATAGLVFVVGCSVASETTVSIDPTPAPASTATAAPVAQPTNEPSPEPERGSRFGVADEPTAEPAEAEPAVRQVLVAAEVIPRGTAVRELLETPTVYLVAQALPESQVQPSAIASIAELSEFANMVVVADLAPGDQLLATSFRDPSAFDSGSPADAEAAVKAAVDAAAEAAGNEAVVLLLQPEQAVMGLLRAGDVVSVVATTAQPDQRFDSILVTSTAEVLNFESQLPSSSATPTDATHYVVTIAVEPGEAIDLDVARSDSSIITLTYPSAIFGEHVVAVTMTKDQALQGTVREGDVVDVVWAVGAAESIVRDADVLNVSATLGDADSSYSILLSVTDDELLELTEAMALDDVALTR